MKKILVPLTLTGESNAAVSVAAHFAQACNAAIVLLHAVPRGVDGGTSAWALPLNEGCMPAVGCTSDSGRRRPISLKDAYQELDLIAVRIRPRAPVDIVVCTGSPTEIILTEAADQHVDAIVMGTHGCSGWRSWLHRNTALQVLKAAACPVWHVSPGSDKQAFNLTLANQGSADHFRRPVNILTSLFHCLFPQPDTRQDSMVFKFTVNSSRTGSDRLTPGDFKLALQSAR